MLFRSSYIISSEKRSNCTDIPPIFIPPVFSSLISFNKIHNFNQKNNPKITKSIIKNKINGFFKRLCFYIISWKNEAINYTHVLLLLRFSTVLKYNFFLFFLLLFRLSPRIRPRSFYNYIVYAKTFHNLEKFFPIYLIRCLW